METLLHVAEIVVSYKTKVRAKDRLKIVRSVDAHKILFDVWDKETIEYAESFYLLVLNRANKVLGYRVVSTGGTAGTVVDVKQVLAIAIVANASAIIVAHNHPSGALYPSQADFDLTNKIKNACNFLDLKLLDHLILAPDGTYCSLADDGLLGVSGLGIPSLLFINHTFTIFVRKCK